MWRSIFLSVGISMLILGGECLVVEKAVFAKSFHESEPADPLPESGLPRSVEPPEWAPWSLLSGGAVVILYSFTIPRRVSGG